MDILHSNSLALVVIHPLTCAFCSLQLHACARGVHQMCISFLPQHTICRCVVPARNQALLRTQINPRARRIMTWCTSARRSRPRLSSGWSRRWPRAWKRPQLVRTFKCYFFNKLKNYKWALVPSVISRDKSIDLILSRDLDLLLIRVLEMMSTFIPKSRHQNITD